MANLLKSIYTGSNVTAIGEVTSSDTISIAGNLTIGGTLKNTSGDFTIDPNPDGTSGKLVVNGNLQVDGTTTTINSTTLTVQDKIIVVGQGNSDKSVASSSGGSGLNVDLGSDGAATLLYEYDSGNNVEKFVFNKKVFSNTTELASTGKAIAMSMVFG